MKKLNKKADIAITILVIGIIALCILALMSFYVSDERRKSAGFKPVLYSQKIYSIAEAVKYSGVNLADKYGAEDIVVKVIGGKGLIEKKYYKQKKWYQFFKDDEVFLEITYRFDS